MTRNTIGPSGPDLHIVLRTDTTPSNTRPGPASGREQAGSTPTARPRAGSDPLVSGRVSTGPGLARRNSLQFLRPDRSAGSRAALQVGVYAPASRADMKDEAATSPPGSPMTPPALMPQVLRRAVPRDLQNARTALGHPQEKLLLEAPFILNPVNPGHPVNWTKNIDALNKEMAELPEEPKNRKLVATVSESLVAAASHAYEWARKYCPAEHSELRDQIESQMAVALKAMAATIGKHEVVHDKKRMNALIDRFMGTEGTVLSGQTAFSELPQHALKLPVSKEGNAQTVEMLTKMAKMAVEPRGLQVLQSAPSWAEFLVDDRIKVILDRKGIDLQEHPELQKAVEALLQKGTYLSAFSRKQLDEMNIEDIMKRATNG